MVRKVTVPAAIAYLRKNPNDTIVLVGLADAIEAELGSFKMPSSAIAHSCRQ